MCLTGSIALHTEFYAPLVMKTGDSIYIDSGMGHAMVALNDAQARVLSVYAGTGCAIRHRPRRRLDRSPRTTARAASVQLPELPIALGIDVGMRRVGRDGLAIAHQGARAGPIAGRWPVPMAATQAAPRQEPGCPSNRCTGMLDDVGHDLHPDQAASIRHPRPAAAAPDSPARGTPRCDGGKRSPRPPAPRAIDAARRG